MWNVRPAASPYVVRSLRRLPIRRDVYADRSGFADDVDPFTSAGGFNLHQQWMGFFRDTREVWAAAWIDSAASLKRAYHQVLIVETSEERGRLLDELADLPITLPEVLAHKAKREGLEAHGSGDARLEISRQRLAWAQRFRAHYASVAHKAQALTEQR